jgi:hypothetical protein
MDSQFVGEPFRVMHLIRRWSVRATSVIKFIRVNVCESSSLARMDAPLRSVWEGTSGPDSISPIDASAWRVQAAHDVHG